MKRTLALTLAILFALAALAGCQNQGPFTDPEPDLPAAPVSTPEDMSNVPTSAPESGFAENMVLSRPAFPAAASYENMQREQVDEDYIEGVREFAYLAAVKTLLNAADPNESAMTSPMSLYFVLAMLSGSASGESQKELMRALGADDDAKYSMQNEAAKLFKNLYFDNEYGKCAVYNSMWLSRDYAFNKEKLDELARYYYAESIVTDFTSDGYKEAIAQWISERTNGFLTPPPDAFDAPKAPPLIMMLINTVYFKSEWMDKFGEDFTKPDTFKSISGESQTCDFMNATRQGAFYKGDGYTVSSLSLKYGSMRFILPDEGVSPADILGDETKLNKAVSYDYDEGGFGEVIWQVPKFEFNTTFDLTDTVKSLGFESAFDGSVDFSALTDSQLMVSRVSQGSRVAIDENGVEAAAYTDMMACGAAMPTETAEMKLTRPFIFIIEYQDVPLFVGVVNQMA